MQEKLAYEAGVWEQASDEDSGFVVWSYHSTEAMAMKAARRYAADLKEHGPATGGMLSWSGGYRHVDGPVTWIM